MESVNLRSNFFFFFQKAYSKNPKNKEKSYMEIHRQFKKVTIKILLSPHKHGRHRSSKKYIKRRKDVDMVNIPESVTNTPLYMSYPTRTIYHITGQCS